MGRNNDYMTGNLLDYKDFSKNYILNATDLSKQNEIGNPDLRQKINSVGRSEHDWFFIIEKSGETTFKFSLYDPTIG